MNQKNILVGNSYPMSLIRREVHICPEDIGVFRSVLAAAKQIHSFWGHSNTLVAASAVAGVDLAPRTERSALSLASEGYPQLNEVVFSCCWLLSPQYKTNFRPQIGEEVDAAMIVNWQVLKMEWV